VVQNPRRDASGEIDVRQAVASSGREADPGLARHLSELARDLQSRPDTEAVMQRIVQAAVEEIDGAIGAAITLLTSGQITSPTHSDERAAKVGTIESDTAEGPCVDTARDQVTIRCDDLRTDPRWPNFSQRAVELGVVSILSFQLFVAAESMGALNVYGGSANAFDQEAESTGLLLASHAAIAMASSRNDANLRIGMDSRDVIGQAKGILMERYKINGQEAFELLVVASQTSHRKLREVAAELAATGVIASSPDAGDTG
jgi:transcriptional regulator with GAF, ATPase, and Fis domain